MNVLIDENLSPSLVVKFADIGIWAVHAAHHGLSGVSDTALFEHALNNEQVVATINASDFLHLAAGSELHPGLIVLRISGLTREEQWSHIEPAAIKCLDIEAEGGDLINQVVEITGSGAFVVYPLPDLA